MLLTVVFGSVSLINAVIDMFDPSISYYAGPIDPAREMALRDELRRTYPDATEEQIQKWALERLQAEQKGNLSRDMYYRWRRLIQSAMLVIVAFPVYRYHWRLAQSLSD
jgi:hypothetical protein